jgi:hypothetical protein
MTRYRITNRGDKYAIQRWDGDTARWIALPNMYDAPTAELAGRTVDAMVAMERNREATTA